MGSGERGPAPVVSVGQQIHEATAAVRNLLGGYIVGMLSLSYVLPAVLQAGLPVWLTATLAVPLAATLVTMVAVLIRAGLTTPDKLLQSEVLSREARDELVEYDLEALVEAAVQRRMAAVEEPTTSEGVSHGLTS